MISPTYLNYLLRRLPPTPIHKGITTPVRIGTHRPHRALGACGSRRRRSRRYATADGAGLGYRRGLFLGAQSLVEAPVAAAKPEEYDQAAEEDDGEQDDAEQRAARYGVLALDADGRLVRAHHVGGAHARCYGRLEAGERRARCRAR